MKQPVVGSFMCWPGKQNEDLVPVSEEDVCSRPSR